MPRKIAVLVGSLRRESYSRKIGLALIGLSSQDLELELIEIRNLPLYDEDLDEQPPEEWVKFRDRIRASDGVLFVTPEYNRSIPGVLKNALDVGSRPYGDSAWQGKPGAVVSVSPGALGGFGANHHLRQCLVFLDVPCMQQPELYLGTVSRLLDEQGAVSDAAARGHLEEFIRAYEHWIQTIIGKEQRSAA
jgi:chromate reductase